MRLLRRTLRWQAVLWFAFGLVLLIAPGWLVEVVLDQPALGEDAWLRAGGAMAVALAGQMVLVGRAIEEAWWWSWTFVILEVVTALIFLANAVAGVPRGGAAWPWWLLGIVNAAIAAVEIAALAKAGTERSPV